MRSDDLIPASEEDKWWIDWVARQIVTEREEFWQRQKRLARDSKKA